MSYGYRDKFHTTAQHTGPATETDEQPHDLEADDTDVELDDDQADEPGEESTDAV